MARSVVPEVWRPWIAESIVKTNNLIGQGFVEMDMNPDFKEKSTMFHIPILQDLDTTLGDDTQITNSTTLTGTGLTDKEEIGVIVHRGDAIYGFDVDDLDTGVKALQKLAPQIGTVVSKNIQRRLVDVTTGVFGSALSDNEHDVTSDDTSYLTPGILLDGLQDIYGEVADDLTTVILHSKVYAELMKDSLITMDTANGVQSAEQLLKFGPMRYFGDKRVIINDSLCAPSGSNYYTYVFGGKPWYVGYQSSLQIEAYRKPLENKNYLIWYYSVCPHLRGVKWNTTTTNPANTDLQTVGNWAQVALTKNIKIMRIKHTLNTVS